VTRESQVAVRPRPGLRRWAFSGGIAIVALAAIVIAAVILRGSAWGQDFLARYPGHGEPTAGTPVGFPAWVGWQHFLNALMMLLIVRSGWQIRSEHRAPAYWTRRNTGVFRTKNPPRRISITLWLHLGLDLLWLTNGIVFFVLLFASGQWRRIVPTSWDVIPNALSAAFQYASLAWPTESGWTNYNSLQLLAYFVTVFVAAPLAVLSGVRMSPFWPRNAKRLSALYPLPWARAVHFPVMLYFVLFALAHVTLVLATGALRNLNHMYAGRDDESWIGFGIFAASLLVMVGLWLAAKPIIVRSIAGLSGSISR